jgi:hypothetical protein
MRVPCQALQRQGSQTRLKLLAFSFILDIGCKARPSVMQTGGRDILPMRGLRMKIWSGHVVGEGL